LRKVKVDAEAALGEKIGQAVITVPAYFNDRQRVATKEAGALAGLDVMRIINEPTAAALAYGLEREDAHTILVWDLGGGTFDVSILELGDGIFEVRAVGGDAWLGGDDFDQRVADSLAVIGEQPTGVDVLGDPTAMQRLREAAEAAKIELSSSALARVQVPLRDLGAPEDLDLFMGRAELEALTADLLHRMAVCTKQVLADAQLTPEHLDRVILVGGATRMPAVRRLAESLTGKRPYRYLDPDLLVALGAATHAGMLLGLIEKAVLLDVLLLSLGVETQGGLMATIIPRNTPLPASEAQIFTTATDYQTSLDIHVLQGERVLAAENVSLDQLRLDGIPPAVRGMAKVEVAFEADVDGIIHVSATDLWSDIQVKAKIASTKLLDPTEVAHSAEEAERSLDQDRQKRERITAAIEKENAIAPAEKALS
jgi:molecular chaperone DnaK